MAASVSGCIVWSSPCPNSSDRGGAAGWAAYRRPQPTSRRQAAVAYRHWMELQPRQAEQVGRVIRPMLGYLHRLQRRAEQVLDPNDRLFLLIDQTCNGNSRTRWLAASQLSACPRTH